MFGSSVQGEATCHTGATCTVFSSEFPPQPVTPSSVPFGVAAYDTTATAPGASGIVQGNISWFFTNPAWAGPGTTHPELSDVVRCDNNLPPVGQSWPGCIIWAYIPPMIYSLTGPFPELAAHIQAAQQSGLPGAYPNGLPLNRTANATLR